VVRLAPVMASASRSGVRGSHEALRPRLLRRSLGDGPALLSGVPRPSDFRDDVAEIAGREIRDAVTEIADVPVGAPRARAPPALLVTLRVAQACRCRPDAYVPQLRPRALDGPRREPTCRLDPLHLEGGRRRSLRARRSFKQGARRRVSDRPPRRASDRCRPHEDKTAARGAPSDKAVPQAPMRAGSELMPDKDDHRASSASGREALVEAIAKEEGRLAKLESEQAEARAGLADLHAQLARLGPERRPPHRS